MFEAFDDGVAVGSHDPAMIADARELHAEHGTPYEVQMLTGVREAAQFDLASDPDVDAEVYQYIPYGSKWLSYFYRRLRERKSNALFALRAVIGRWERSSGVESGRLRTARNHGRSAVGTVRALRIQQLRLRLPEVLE